MSKAYDIVMGNRKELVEQLISQMEKGYAATRAAWSKNSRPYNPVSNAVYKAGNRFRLMMAAEEMGFSDSRWLTFKQASEKGYKIAPGAKSVLLEKWIFYKDVPVLDENQKPILENGKPVLERTELDRPVVNYFRVFNGEQVTGLPELQKNELTEDEFSKMADCFERSSSCPIAYEAQDRAYYSVTEDKIHLPLKEVFKNNEARLSVLLHEMSHSTGHPDRLDRSLKNRFGSVDYAKEELNAEISSLFLESDLGIKIEPDSEMLKDHSNYIKSWISVLKDDPNELFRACAAAEQITDFLIKNYERQLEIEKEEWSKSKEKSNMEINENSQNLGNNHLEQNPVPFREELQKQIEDSGFRPTESLIKNMEQFLKLEGRRYSLRELADLSRFKPNFNGNIQKQECFETIIKECREQEMENLKEIQKTRFLRREMMEEMALLPNA